MSSAICFNMDQSKILSSGNYVRSGRPSSATTKNDNKKITDLRNQDVRYTVRGLAGLANFFVERVDCILRKHLKLGKKKCKMDATFVNR